ncbi:alpha/beta fold hydrolase [[Actinomadura] parvosata]|uniref:alpha/beta fold hydrolase n=1 Tax=[Actinomadura] parvosata TaxID=1955412 RepID=UPI00406D0320
MVMLHGGPGVPDCLAPVAAIIDDLCLVHRYGQRGTGGSPREGEHTIARHIEDLTSLLDTWGHDRAVLMGHSFGTNLAAHFLLAHPERVAGLIQIAGPFLGPWPARWSSSRTRDTTPGWRHRTSSAPHSAPQCRTGPLPQPQAGELVSRERRRLTFFGNPA